MTLFSRKKEKTLLDKSNRTNIVNILTPFNLKTSWIVNLMILIIIQLNDSLFTYRSHGVNRTNITKQIISVHIACFTKKLYNS